MAFHAKVSDPIIGGTYMTLLNTVSNLGKYTTCTSLLPARVPCVGDSVKPNI